MPCFLSKIRTDMRIIGSHLAKNERKEMQEYLLSISDQGRLWCAKIVEGVKLRDRTCMRLYGEAMKWVGAQPQIAAIFMERFQIPNENEMERLIEDGKRMRQMSDAFSLEQAVDDAIEVLVMAKRSKPELLKRVWARLATAVGTDDTKALSALPPGQLDSSEASVVESAP